MCGIAGICHLAGYGDIGIDDIERMTAIFDYRGPDESGIYIDDRAGLGHARLSILDLEKGSQPMHNEDQTLWITYNGEVFNYPELRRELVKKGHRFYTTSDTEVLLHLYEDKGPACLEELNGQFAFAIWDSRRKKMFLARDRAGIRPLYYTIHDNKFIFASEIKSIFTVAGIDRRIDPVSIDQICTFWCTLPGRTAFKGIRQLLPGHYLEICDGTVNIKKFWQQPFFSKDEQLTIPPAEIAGHLDGLLHDAIKIRLRADVPVGCYLSGGLDSSGITSRIVRHFNSKVKSFGIRFEEAAFDEGNHQNLMVSYLGVDHSQLQATNEQIGRVFPDVVRHCETPLLRTAPAPLFLLSKLVNENGLKVVLTGEGADEYFGGYNIYREAKIRRFMARQPGSKKRAELLGRLYPYIFTDPRAKHAAMSFFSRGLEDVQNPFYSHVIRWATTDRIKTFFSEQLRAEVGSYSCLNELKGTLPAEFERWDYLQKAQYLETSLFMSNYLLSSQGDRVAMAHSVEIRMPYLDYRIMQYLGRVPSKWKVLGLDEKHILKQTLKNDLPEPILKRSKNPYRAPIKESLLNRATEEYIEEVLSEKAVKDAGLFDAARTAGLLQKMKTIPQAGEVDGMALACIISTQLLHKMFIRDFPGRIGRHKPADLLIDKRSLCDNNNGLKTAPKNV